MQWTDARGMAFTTAGADPWLPFSHCVVSVEAQVNDPTSTLSLYRSLLTIRHETPELKLGDISMIDRDNNYVLAYERLLPGSSTLVAINFSDEPRPIEFSRVVRQVLSTHTPRNGSLTSMMLGPNEAVIVQ